MAAPPALPWPQRGGMGDARPPGSPACSTAPQPACPPARLPCHPAPPSHAPPAPSRTPVLPWAPYHSGKTNPCACAASPRPPQVADIWSCGVMLYVMLVGAYPFERPEDKHDNQKLQKMIQARPAAGLLLLAPGGRQQLPLGRVSQRSWLAKAPTP